MFRFSLVTLSVLALAACQSTPNSHMTAAQDYTEIAEKYSCQDISEEIDRMEAVLASASPSETERLFTNTAISAARTGVNVSGVLGNAGAFAGIGMNFLQQFYALNAEKRQQKIKDIALEQQNILWDAYSYKNCSA